MPFGQQIFLAHSHSISKWHPGSRGGGGGGGPGGVRVNKTKQKNAEKFLNSL